MENESKKHLVTKSPENKENTSKGKLCIKLKVRKIEEPLEDINPIEENSYGCIRVCEVCKKGFCSGKALGGHMRVHSQANRGDLNNISKNPNTVNQNSIEKSQHFDHLSENPTCSLCGKGFPSLKSLFGHMRCHPERDYRGIKPPQTGHSSSSTVSDQRETTNSTTDLAKTLPSWSATAKRGRRSLIATATSSSSGEGDSLFMSEEEREVVRDLMKLAEAESTDSGLTTKHQIEATNIDWSKTRAEFGYKNQVFESKKLRIEDIGYGSKCKKLKINERVPLGAKGKSKALFGSMEDSLSSDELIATRMRVKKFTKRKPKFRDLKSVQNEDKDEDDKVVEKGPVVKYRCSTCNKCFPSHQALGGHRSSHNKIKFTNHPLARLDNELALVLKLENGPLVSRGDDTKELSNDNVPFHAIHIHQCKICQKIFPTGQALGGHMRCHWVGPEEGTVSSHATSSLGEDASQTGTERVVLGFDLNELPSMEEDGDGAYGNFSSANN